MKKNTDQNTCPGCGRHCPACAPRCKYGCRYFRKMAEAACPAGGCCGAGKKKEALKNKGQSKKREEECKWARYAPPGGLGYSLLSAARTAKKGLRKGRFTEEAFFGALSDAQQAELRMMLEKLIAR